jgi:hypothetical protein
MSNGGEPWLPPKFDLLTRKGESGMNSRSKAHRRASEPEFRRWCDDNVYADHVAPVNQLVDALKDDQRNLWLPYVAPYHGGAKSKAVLLFQDPGPMTQSSTGSGMIGCENDDPSAELLACCLDEASVEQFDVVPWNAYPWYIPDQTRPTAAMLEAGLDPLRKLLDLCPSVEVVVTGGTVAADSWRRFGKRFPVYASKYKHVSTFHTSRRGITNGGRQKRDEGVAAVVAALRSVNA